MEDDQPADRTLGLRYDVEIIPVPERNNPASPSEDDYPVDKNNIQPRIGLSYVVDEQAGGRARAGTAGSTTRPTSRSSAASSTTAFLRVVYRELPGISAADPVHVTAAFRPIRCWSTVPSRTGRC